MNKVVLTKAQADAINHWLCSYVGGEEALLKQHLEKGEWVEETAALNGMPFMTLAQALINGYEVEQNPEETLKELVFKLRESRDFSYAHREFYCGKLEGVIDTLTILKINLKGVNC